MAIHKKELGYDIFVKKVEHKIANPVSYDQLFFVHSV